MAVMRGTPTTRICGSEITPGVSVNDNLFDDVL